MPGTTYPSPVPTLGLAVVQCRGCSVQYPAACLLGLILIPITSVSACMLFEKETKKDLNVEEWEMAKWRMVADFLTA